MPNRVVREDILSSDKVDKLSYAAEVFYRRLMSMLDDYGCGDGRVSIIRSTLYPLRLEKVSESDISKWISECEKAGLVRQYQSGGKPYLVMWNFGQTVRQKRRKFPPPIGVVDPMQADASNCEQMQADASLYRNETKRNETKGITPHDPSDYYRDAKEAFEEMQQDELFIESLLRIVHGAGFRYCNEITIMLAVRKFLTVESAKSDFVDRRRSEVRKHLVNWMNKNAGKLEEYAK
jgi:hypothetical protein